MEKDNVDVRRFATATALGTIMGKVFGLRSPHSSALLDRCPTFVSKDKSLKAKLIGKTRKVHTVLYYRLCIYSASQLRWCSDLVPKISI
jgi:hypothetical protein